LKRSRSEDRALTKATKATGPRQEAVRWNAINGRSTVNDHGLAVAIVIPVVIAITTLPDHDSIAIPVVALANNFTVAIPIAIAVARSHGHAAGADTNSDFFRASRHRNADSGRRDGGN
jgi:hypothetical protein